MRTTVVITGILLSFLVSTSLSARKNNLILLNDTNWDLLLQGEWMVDFVAPWCPACKALEPKWQYFSTWAEDLGIKVASIDVTTSPGSSGRFMVSALPTIYHVINGEFRQYKGNRDAESMSSFVEEKKWQAIEPITKWLHPNGVLMNLTAYVFRMSMTLKAIHTKLVEEYGIPIWGSYLLFAVATIFVGALIGLLIVLVIDCFFPPDTTVPPDVVPRPKAKKPVTLSATEEESSLEEEIKGASLAESDASSGEPKKDK